MKKTIVLEIIRNIAPRFKRKNIENKSQYKSHGFIKTN